MRLYWCQWVVADFVIFLIVFVFITISYNRVNFPSLVSPSLGFVSCAVTVSSCVATSTSAVLSMGHNEPVVSAEWLHANLGDPDVKVLDSSWYLPDEQRNPLQE